jgi:hypothetical protein
MPTVLAYKIVFIAGFVVLISWVIDYTRTGGRWWRNPVTSTMVYEALLLAGLLVPTTLNLFFMFSRLTSSVASWFDLCMFGLVIPVMIWRIFAVRRVRKYIRRCSRGHVLTYRANFCAECGLPAGPAAD